LKRFLNIWEYTKPGKQDDLKYLSIGCTTYCNLNCSFCSKKGKKAQNLEPQLLKSALDDAIRLGLTKVELTGGEPLMYPQFWDMLEYCYNQNITVLLVSNGTLINQDTARRLYELRASVSISLSTLNAKEYEQLTGIKGNFSAVINAAQYLKDVGFKAHKIPVIGIQSVALKGNINELEAIGQWCNKNGYLFILNRPIPVGGLAKNEVLSAKELKDFLDKESNGNYQVNVPFNLATPCNRLKVGCYIGSDARVRPCPAIDIAVGSIKEQKLKNIWNNSPLLKKCREINKHLQGSCARCSQREHCYGCRAVAYAVWGSLTAPDPGCFRFKPDKIFNIGAESK